MGSTQFRSEKTEGKIDRRTENRNQTNRRGAFVTGNRIRNSYYRPRVRARLTTMIEKFH